MEFPAKSVKIERALAVAALAAVLAAVWLESRSTVADCVRANKTWAAWFSFEAAPKPPELYLALFHPGSRDADLIYVPGSTVGADGRPLSAAREDALNNDADPAGAAKDEADAARELLLPLLPLEEESVGDRFVYAEAAPSDAPDEALAGRAWLSRLPARLAFSRHGLRANVGRADRLVAALELARLRAQGPRPAWLPQDEIQRRALLARLASGAPDAPSDHITVEVLNAVGRKGLALDATKVLRLNGADVMSSGNAPQEQARTAVYDRTGRFDKALAVKRMLGCQAAQAATKIDPRALVDVTVVLAEDCAKGE